MSFFRILFVLAMPMAVRGFRKSSKETVAIPDVSNTTGSRGNSRGGVRNNSQVQNDHVRAEIAAKLKDLYGEDVDSEKTIQTTTTSTTATTPTTTSTTTTTTTTTTVIPIITTTTATIKTTTTTTPTTATETTTSTTTTTMKSCQNQVGEILHTIQWTPAIRLRFASNAGKVKVFSGSEVKWSDLLKDKWPVAHEYERKRMLSIGRLAEANESESKVRGFCDMSLLAMKFWSHSSKFLDAVRDLLPTTECKEIPLKELSESTMSAMQEICFESCVSTLKTLVADLPCEMEKLNEHFYNATVNSNEQCAATPVDTLEWISAYSLFRRCGTFLPQTTSYVWRIDDKDPQTIGVKVCQLPPNKSKAKREDIVMQGTCPEGSKCKCPMTELKSRDTSAMIRFKNKQSIFSMAGVGAVPSIMKQYASGYVISTVVVQMGVNGLALAAAALATLEAPMFLAMGTLVLSIKAGVSFFKFQCASTLGCWPQHPERRKLPGTPKACRMPDKTQEGRSPVWFLPPPLLKISHEKTACILKACTKSEIWKHRIGLGNSENSESKSKYPGKPNVYNCQPLTYEEMTPELRQEFLKRLIASGVSNEYELPPF